MASSTRFMSNEEISNNSWAQAMKAWNCQGEERLKWVILACLQGEPRGYYVLAIFFAELPENDRIFHPDKELRIRLLKKAAQLGFVDAMSAYAEEAFVLQDPEKYFWGSQVFFRDYGIVRNSFLEDCIFVVKEFNSGKGNSKAICQIGSLFKNGIDEDKIKYASCANDFLNAIKIAVEYYHLFAN